MIDIKKLHKTQYSKEIFILKNKTYVRKSSLTKKKIEYNEHTNWLKKYIKKNYFYVITSNKKFAGYIRVENKNISWALEKKYWGKINFFKYLKKISKTGYKAVVKKNNVPSLMVALKAGFKIQSLTGELIFLVK